MKFGFSEQAPALPPPASADLRASGGNLSFVTFHLFSPSHYFFFSLSLSPTAESNFPSSLWQHAKGRRVIENTHENKNTNKERGTELLSQPSQWLML